MTLLATNLDWFIFSVVNRWQKFRWIDCTFFNTNVYPASDKTQALQISCAVKRKQNKMLEIIFNWTVLCIHTDSLNTFSSLVVSSLQYICAFKRQNLWAYSLLNILNKTASLFFHKMWCSLFSIYVVRCHHIALSDKHWYCIPGPRNVRNAERVDREQWKKKLKAASYV